MNASVILFYIIAAFILISGFLAVTTRKIFRSAIWLLAALIGVAAFYFWMEMPFIAAVQIVVYVGGIVVLIIFSIFLTQQSGKEMRKPPLARNLAAIGSVLLGLLLVSVLVYQYQFSKSTETLNADVENIGTQMLSTADGGYALPFEVVSILLLAAMVGCIIIAMKSKTEVK